LEPELSSDDDVNRFFARVEKQLQNEFAYTLQQAAALIREYYESFRNEAYCDSLGLPVQDDEFFFHEGVRGMALRVHYYLGIRGNPDHEKFLAWRASTR
jgi:hypothetical protein